MYDTSSSIPIPAWTKDSPKTHRWGFLLIAAAVVGAVVARVFIVKKSRNNANHDAPAPAPTVQMTQQ